MIEPHSTQESLYRIDLEKRLNRIEEYLKIPEPEKLAESLAIIEQAVQPTYTEAHLCLLPTENGLI